MPYCDDCGQYTTRRGFFQYLCPDCHDEQDQAVESYCNTVASSLGVNPTWSDPKPNRDNNSESSS